MLHEKHGGAGGKEQFFQLDAGKNIDKVQRLVPEEQVCRLTQRDRQQYFLFLSFAVLLDPFFKLDSFQPQFSEHSPEKSVIKSLLFGEARECPVQPGSVL